MYDDRQHFGRMGFGFGPFGPGRFFERGDLKLVILDLINKKPRHGYDVIQELEDRFHGLYNPSAGSIYPVLQLLEDRGFVTIDQKDSKKVYSITPEGKEYLEDHKEDLASARERGDHFQQRFGPYADEIFEEVKGLAPLMIKNLRNDSLKDEKKMKAFKIVLRDFRKKIEEIFGEQ